MAKIDTRKLYSAKPGAAPVVVGNNRFFRVAKNGTKIFTLHGTDIVKIARGGKVTVSTGGYMTPTTTSAISGALNVLLKGLWGASLAKGVLSVYGPQTAVSDPAGRKVKFIADPL